MVDRMRIPALTHRCPTAPCVDTMASFTKAVAALLVLCVVAQVWMHGCDLPRLLLYNSLAVLSPNLEYLLACAMRRVRWLFR